MIWLSLERGEEDEDETEEMIKGKHTYLHNNEVWKQLFTSIRMNGLSKYLKPPRCPSTTG